MQRNWNPHPLLVGMGNGAILRKTVSKFLTCLNIVITCPRNSKKIESMYLQRTCTKMNTGMFTAALLLSLQNANNANVQQVNE